MLSFAKDWLQQGRAFYWLDASSTETLVASFNDFAIEVKLEQSQSSPGAPKLTVRTVCKYVLAYPEDWLFVFDNYDLPDQERYDVGQYFPWSAKGNIIVTNRTHDVAGEIGGDSQQQGNCLEVGLMSEGEAIMLLQKSAAPPGTPSGASSAGATALRRRIAIELLGGLPLAIAQAGAYLRNNRIPGSLPITQRLQRYCTVYSKHEANMLDGQGGTTVKQ